MAKVLNLPKARSGIKGLDEITFGGLPQGRPTLIVGDAGSGKTMLAMEFLVRGATEFDEPGVFVAFEETALDLTVNFASRGYDLDALIQQKKLYIDHIHVDWSEIEETGEYDLEGLFIRLAYAVDAVGAKRVVIDTIEALFGGLTNTGIIRAELRRLFSWLKSRGLTVILTGERGNAGMTRYGLEEYVADCVILIDNRVTEQISTRRLRIVKYRGSQHGANEYPFLIESNGVLVAPITSLGLDHEASSEWVSSGIERLDTMLGGKGYYLGSSILVSGTAGTGKSSLVSTFVDAACRRGERCLYFAFEESPSQIVRNMRSIGIDLQTWTDQRLLIWHASRPTSAGLETHLAKIRETIASVAPSCMVMDPISNLTSAGNDNEVKSMLMRLIDYLKSKHVTALFTNLTSETRLVEQAEVGVSSLMDTWIVLRDVERQGERNREIHIIKSRGMSHSNQLREYLMTDDGIKLLDVYVGSAGVLTGTARVSQETKEEAEKLAHQLAIERAKRELERNRKVTTAQIEALQAELENTEEELNRLVAEEEIRAAALDAQEARMSALRGADKLDRSNGAFNGSQGGNNEHQAGRA